MEQLKAMAYREKCVKGVRDSLAEAVSNMDKRIASGNLAVAIAEVKIVLSIIGVIVSTLDDTM
jgi:hypothetical protein